MAEQIQQKSKQQEREAVKRQPSESKLDWIQRIVPAWYFEIIREKLNVEQVDQHFGIIKSDKFSEGRNTAELRAIFGPQMVSEYSGPQVYVPEDFDDDDLQ